MNEDKREKKMQKKREERNQRKAPKQGNRIQRTREAKRRVGKETWLDQSTAKLLSQPVVRSNPTCDGK